MAHSWAILMIKIRGQDNYGNGAYGARRRKGLKVYKHQGIDPVCVPGEAICAFEEGIITKIGFPYDPNDPEREHYRYVEITVHSGDRHRYMYTHPMVDVGQRVSRGEVLGASQDLDVVFTGITQHYHYEIRRGRGVVSPVPYLKELGYEFD